MSYLIDIDSDYVGYWSISTSTYSSDDFETFIDQYEKMGIEYISLPQCCGWIGYSVDNGGLGCDSYVEGGDLL